jgi:hypothetical protein
VWSMANTQAYSIGTVKILHSRLAELRASGRPKRPI